MRRSNAADPILWPGTTIVHRLGVIACRFASGPTWLCGTWAATSESASGYRMSASRAGASGLHRRCGTESKLFHVLRIGFQLNFGIPKVETRGTAHSFAGERAGPLEWRRELATTPTTLFDVGAWSPTCRRPPVVSTSFRADDGPGLPAICGRAWEWPTTPNVSVHHGALADLDFRGISAIPARAVRSRLPRSPSRQVRSATFGSSAGCSHSRTRPLELRSVQTPRGATLVTDEVA